MINLDSVELSELSDDETELLLASSGRGKPSIYRPVMVDLLGKVGPDRNVSLTVHYSEINPATDATRSAVLAGIRQASKNEKFPAGARFNFVASGDDNVRILIARETA